MAVGVFTRSSSESDMSKAFPNMRQQRRNGMAYIFFGQSNEEISCLKQRFLKKSESFSSGSDSSDMEPDVESGDTQMCVDITDEIIENKVSDSELESDCSSVPEDDSMESEVETSSDSECQGLPRTRRFALADIFEGVPESEVSEFLAQFSSCDSSDNVETEMNPKFGTLRTRRHAKCDIFEGVSQDKIDALREKFFHCTSDVNGDSEDVLPDGYLRHRRGAVANIFEDIDDDLKSRLAQHFMDELNDCKSDETDSSADSEDSESLINGLYPDIPAPQQSYLWRRRFALANIFEDVDTTTEFQFRAQ